MVLYHSMLSVALGFLSMGLVVPSAAGIVSAPRAALRQPASPGYRPRDEACPASCKDLGPDTSKWSVYRSLDEFKYCNKVVFHQFNIFDNVDDGSKNHRILACSSGNNDFLVMPNATTNSASINSVVTPINGTYELGWLASGHLAKSSITVLATMFRTYLTSGYAPTNTSTVLFAKFGGTSMGVYIGKGLHNEETGDFALGYLIDNLESMAISGGSLAMQLCGPTYDGDHTFGFMASSNGSYTPAQQAMHTWRDGNCLSFGNSSQSVSGPVVLSTPLHLNETSRVRINGTTGAVSAKFRRSASLLARDECSTVQVVSGDGCASLAAECGITGEELSKYNPASDFCATLQVGQHICCSSGTLPDFSPKPNSDGTCATYTVVADDTCSGIASSNSLSLDDIESFNTDTWGWSGCDRLLLGSVMCLSSGTAPMPAINDKAVCGPTAPGTVAPESGVNISSLNPCPLNACCDVWGQCGITSEFCTDTGTGAPGTAASGTNGCISNCGTDIVQTPGGSFITIGYYEGYNLGRDCLFQDASQIDASAFTHLHYSFGTISADFSTVSVGDELSQYEFNAFKRITSVKRILSFGGWAFSTDASTYSIFREGVTEANRQTLATTIANFINDNDLDGVDIDWEYPGAPDIPGIPAGSEDDGPNYVEFLKVLKGLLPDKSVSIAAPASYWYLKPFPIKDIGEVIDYVVFMTYDLHGQWDYGNQYAQEGCPGGDCLRSNVNLTETLTALAMVTKAGLPSNKVIVGVSSYGRSYNMASEGCHTADCQYTGSAGVSDATAGPCTNTAGYLSDAEIKAIIAGTSVTGGALSRREYTVTESYLDEDSNSNILVFNGNQWVGWMDADVRASRITQYQALGMGGSTNWAIDLEDFNEVPAGTASTWEEFKASIKRGVDPADPNNSELRSGNWSTLTCDNPAVSPNSGLSSEERWSQLDCADAWADAINVWRTIDSKDSILSFSQSVANSLHGPVSGTDCGTTTTGNNCEQTINCGLITTDESNAGSFEVWNSLVIIHEMYAGYMNTITAASASIINPQLDTFEDDFAPIPEDKEDWFKIIMGLVTLVGTVGVASVFTRFLSVMPFFAKHKDTKDISQSAASALVSFGTTYGNAMYGSGDDVWDIADQHKFSAYIGQVIFGWQNVTEMALAGLFSGTDEGIDALTKTMQNGQLIGGNGGSPEVSTDDETQTELQNSIAKALFGYVIPPAWRLTDVYPVIIAGGFDCSWEINEGIAGSAQLRLEVAQETMTCVDNEMYFLVYPYETPRTGSFKKPPGYDALDGVAYGGLTVEDLVVGAVNTWKSNGEVNGGGETNPSDSDSLANLMSDGVRARGFVDIPVCQGFTAYTGWENGHTETQFYPCNAPVGLSDCGDSTFVDQTSDGSPDVADCEQIITNLIGPGGTVDGEWEIENVLNQQHQIVEFGTCKFGVQGNGGSNPGFHVGGQDIIDIIKVAIADYGGSGKVGAKGDMVCNGFTSGSVNVAWGLY